MRFVLLGVAAATLTLVTGCGTTTAGTAVADHSCIEVSAPMTAISTPPGGPQLSIPQPQGWERRTELDSKIIRFVMVNKSLVADNFAPNAVVTFESVANSSQTPRQILDGQRINLRRQLMATDVKSEDGTQCGYPSTMISYTPPAMGAATPRKAKVLGVVIESGDKTYLTTLTIGSADDKNTTFATDSDTILKGFAITR
ncbi:LpqN/LpqT family lipoprotein [Mycolicibacterium komossense]|uniref:LpqN/LpqT family lipoprotein n=1 Tax=Mycolicibacterium komossense TaxID=1779 RepID=A0ABT3CDX6_9MYCO|nr:LpqN/LpqT family lipoprotein [Mycolicibacterium komossense]MCV7227675.1 LpqN/LpqT family lipoprotein [Mycolicibacterium komossense]